MADHPLEKHPLYIPNNWCSSQAVLLMSPSFPENNSALQCPTESESEFQYYNKIQQSDLVPTISILLGWTIPRNNIGVILKSVFNLWKGTNSSINRLHEINATSWQRLEPVSYKCRD